MGKVTRWQGAWPEATGGKVRRGMVEALLRRGLCILFHSARAEREPYPIHLYLARVGTALRRRPCILGRGTPASCPFADKYKVRK